MKCSFTGHRNVIVTDELEEKLENEIIKLIQLGITDFYVGGAVGWDMLCGKTVLKLREKYPVRLNVILPCKEDIHTSKWNESKKKELQDILYLSDSIEVISDNYYDGCYKKRNDRLIETADICVCYYDKKRSRCGTGQTVRMAEKKGIDIINLF